MPSRELKTIHAAKALGLTGFARPLLRWYDCHKRELPWRRREQDAYAQLVAEVMLQQTQVATVVPYYERFMKRFPTVKALAEAGIDEVLPLWAGLGYYRRARDLRAAAGKIVERHGERVPETVEELMGLPGVGRYTAGAVASIAYGVRAPVVDGNVGRVLMRLTSMEADPKAPATRAELWRLAEAALPAKRCGDFNQAMMELGATVCTPVAPGCTGCPLKATCRAYLEGSAGRIPPPARRTRVLPAAVVVAAVRCGEKMLFVQRPEKGLWAGLWELPSEPVGEGESIEAARSRLRARLPRGVRLSARPLGTVLRQLTHREITFHVFRATTSARAIAFAGRDSCLEGCEKGFSHQRRLSRQLRVSGESGRRACRWLTAAEAADLGISRACEAIMRFCGL